jgi:phage FluMu gp28-like protein
VIEPYRYQKLMAGNQSRFAMYEWSRQSGKSMGAALAVNLDILEVEAQGRRTLWTLISRSLAQARELARKVRDVGRAIMAARNILKGIAESETRDQLGETQLELTYPGGSRVIIVSGNPNSAAGYTGNVWWDEVGLTQRARELFGTAFPVVSRGGYRFIMTSTPRPGFWVQRWDDAQRGESRWFTHKLTIMDAVAQGCPQDVEQLRAALNDDLRWRQDFLCEHVDDDICWLPWDLIVGATDARCTLELPPRESSWWGPVQASYAGWDVARWQHLSVLWLWHRLGGLLLTRGVVVMQRMPFEQQIELVRMHVGQCPHFVRLCIDATGMGEMVAEQAARRMPGVEGVKLSAPVKEVIAGDFRRLLEDLTARLPDDDELRSDLHSVHRTMTAAGNPRFEGEAEGSHADRFWAGALGLHAAISPGGGLSMDDIELLSKVAGVRRELAGERPRPVDLVRAPRGWKGW